MIATAVGLGILIAVASFVAGFFAGDRYGTSDTERRWSEAVARADDARARREQ